MRSLLLLLALLALACSGCHSPTLHQQVRASAPAMLMGDELAWQAEDRLSSQLESGRAFTGGGGSAGCTSCR
jgi:mono/diheme cytochrome c family protein